MVNRLCEPGRVLDEALATARRIAENAPISVRQVKQSVDRGLQMDLASALRFEVQAYERTLVTEDRREGIEAFRHAYAQWGSWIILIKGLTPIPYKIVTIASGFAGYDLLAFTVLSLITRGAREVLVKLGARGARLITPSEVTAWPAVPVQVVVTTAAGDAFGGALAVALAEGAELGSAIRFASGAAALSVTRAGAQPSMPARAEVEALLARRSD